MEGLTDNSRQWRAFARKGELKIENKRDLLLLPVMIAESALESTIGKYMRVR